MAFTIPIEDIFKMKPYLMTNALQCIVLVCNFCIKKISIWLNYW